MKTSSKIILVFFFTVFSITTAYAQNNQQIAVPLSHPGKPGKLEVALIQGSIKVSGYNGKTVIVHYTAKNKGWMHRDNNQPVPKGMKMIPNNSFGLNATESDNKVTIDSGSPFHFLNLDIEVPRNFSLHLSTVNSGNIEVSNIDGEMDLTNVNGNIILKNVSGSANANTVNGKITAYFNSINKNTPMAFSTLNGDINITLPAKARFTTKMKTFRGNIYTGFDMNLANSQKPNVKTTGGNGTYQVSINNWQYGKVNGGGPEIQLKSFNGNLYIHKK